VLKVTLLINLERLVGKEKLNEAREAVFKALMADIRGVVVYKSLEFGRLVKIEGHSIIDLTIGDKGIAEVKILNGNDAAVQFRDSLEAVVEYFLEIVAKALGVRRGEVLNAIELINTPLSEEQVVL
jgi:hypothetical protein